MKRALSLFAITMSLSVLSLPAAAKRYHTDDSDSDAEQPAPPRRARVDVSDAASSSTAAASSSDAATSAHADDHHTALSHPTFTSFLSYDDLRSLAATSKAGKSAAKDRIIIIANSLQLPADTSWARRIALARISLIQQPYIHALAQAETALTGKSLTKARKLFYSLHKNDEFSKMAYRYTWWKQRRHRDNLDKAVDLKAVFNDFNAAKSYTLNFASLHGLQHDNILAQLIIDLVLCSPEQTILILSALPPQSSIAITSSSLTVLCARDNPGLTVLDLSNNPNLTHLEISKNRRLTALDLRNNPALTKLHTSYNPGLTALDLSNNPALTELDAYNNPGLTALDLSNNPALTYLNADNNPGLTALDLSNTPALTRLSISDTGLTALDLSNNPNLKALDVSYNPGLTTLDLSNNPNLTLLQISNHIPPLELRNPPAFMRLRVCYP